MVDVKPEPVVVIGASAGGIDALSTLVASLAPDFPAPIVVAQHLDPNRESHLRGILARRSPIPVRTVEDRERLEQGVIYVIPPNSFVEIIDNDVVVHRDDKRSPLPSIDLLFTTVAQQFGEAVIAVVLTGTGTDGVVGARDVKAAGGTIVIQNPATASFPGMPSALSPSIVDIVANLESIGPLLGDLLSGKYQVDPPDQDAQLQALLEQLRDRSGIDFSAYKTPTIMRRLQRRMVATSATTLNDYIRYLQHNPDEYQRLINSFLIKVTEFFRDRELFDYFRDHVLPRIITEARERGELRIWSAGCATGEEAYSLAMLVAEQLGDELNVLNVRIFATDLDGEAVEFARRGLYPASALKDVPADMIERYFTRVDAAYEVRKHVRALVVFGQHDLGQRAPFPRIDLVLCRNVLIYFTADLQKRALQLFAFSLRDGGYLALGKAETVSPLPEYFALDHARLKVYRRAGERVLIPTARIRASTPIMPLLPTPVRPSGADLTVRRTLRQSPSQQYPAAQRVESVLLHLPTGVVVVDRRYTIQMINATGRRLLSIHTEAIGEDLIHLVQHVPLLELRNAIDGAFRGESTTFIVQVDAAATGNAEHRDVELLCYPERTEGQNGVMETATIVVSDVSRFMAAQRERDRQIQQLELDVERYHTQVERLSEANQLLTRANGELTAINAELHNANEELLVANEEVQSTTEEVETLNEELQATNEELETLNEELQATVEELNTTNDDLQARSLELQDLAVSLEMQSRESEAQRGRLQAILNNMGDAVLVVKSSGEPILTNRAFDEMFGEAGEGFRPEGESGLLLDGEKMLQQRVASGESFTTEFTITAADGTRRWFEATGQPIAESHGEQRGVIVIREITDRSIRRLQNEFLAFASHELRSPLTSLSGSLQMLQRILGKDAEERVRRHIEIANLQARQLARLIDDLVDVVRLQTGRLNLTMEQIDLARVVRETCEAAQHLTDTQAIHVDGTGDPLIVAGDRTRLEQVLINLLTNASIYAQDSDRIDMRFRREDGLAVLEVQDYGPGIPEEDRERIFSRFFQVERPDVARQTRAGLGLGLFITREIIQAHGGTITVASTVGEGTTFTIRLPLADN